ncbi:MAG: protein kinase [Gammaproteobacteria bacterium]|nr:protein kinase [Gammaproteobacteria bacterium]
MWPKVFIIDDSPDYRALLSHHVATHWPDAAVKQYDPLESGRLPDDFSGAGNDLILLGHPAGEIDALDWLRQFMRIRKFPPVILIGDADERRIVTAIKIGAADYVSKRRLNHRRIIQVMEAALGQSQPIASSGRFFVKPDDLSTSGLPSLRGYEFQRRIVVNEMSAVYLVRQQRSGEMMILKVLRQMPDVGGEAAFDRFLQEYELIAKLDHPNIIKIFDLGVGDDHAYIAMEYCSKGSLKLRISRGLEPDKAFALMRQMAEALGELHRAGITHRDLKPTNVMFRNDESLVLIDFGLAKKAALRAEITGTGEIFGTPYYMSPEQGQANEVDERTDIYSLGIIFFEMLTGQKPFEGDTAMAVIVQHQQAPVPRLPAELSSYQPCIDRMIAKKPDDRFQSVAELLEWMPSDCGMSLAEM